MAATAETIPVETIARFALDNDLTEDEIVKLRSAFAEGFDKYAQYSHKPVSLRDFIERKDMMNAYHPDGRPIVWPLVMDDLEAMNDGTYQEVVLTGGIGVAKTTLALYSIAYQLYLLSCMKSPHERFDLDPASEILIIFQSATATLARIVDYQRFRGMIDNAPYFQNHFPCDKDIKSEMVFPRRIIVRPVSGVATAAIGQNVIGGVIDELNYMVVVEKSAVSTDKGIYDQAMENYNSIARRRSSRFKKMGELPGLLCLVSSTRYPGEFTDHKIAEAKAGKPIYVYNKRLWDIRPDKFGEARFHVFIGDASRKPRILGSDEEIDVRDRDLVISIPEDERDAFEKDIINALREVAGVATQARCPFFMNTNLLAAAFGHHRTILNRTSVDFSRTELQYFIKQFVRPYEKRCVHVDLAVTGDSVGIACGFVDKFVRITRGGGVVEILPKIHIDFTLRVTPPPNDEIQFDKVRSLLYLLRKEGLNIQWVSFDSWQSTYLMQLLRQQGFIATMVSCDVDSVPYDFLKGAIYDGRVEAPKDDFCQQELSWLEKDPKTGKIDHPPHGSKDVADAMAGTVYGLTMKRIIWSDHDVQPIQIPQYIQQMVAKRKDTGNVSDSSEYARRGRRGGA